MLWLAAAREGLDDEHASAAAGARSWQHAGFVGRWGLWGILLFGADRHGEQLARPRDIGGTAATGQQSVVPDAVESPGQHVHQELSLIHISEPTRRTPISYAVFCLKKKKKKQ